jgi:hypothetical protein
MQSLSTVIVFIDRIHEGVAILSAEDGSATVQAPAAWLPAGAHAGDVLSISLSVDAEATKARRQETQSLMDSLGDNV